MTPNTTDKIHIYAVSPSDEIMDWEEEVATKAKRKGIAYDGPIKPPQEKINEKIFRKSIFRFPYSDRGQEILEIDLPDNVYMEVSVGMKIDFDVEDVIPKTEMPTPSQENDNSKNNIKDNNTNEILKNADSTNGEKEAEKTTSSTKADSELNYLREQAEKAAVDSVPKSKVNSRETTREYTRSTEVRRYVMKRADGVCEGCAEPAPFTSKTGEPYLHAHHVHELSDGGSDMRSTVIALCPNCHYRVHHGEDGDEYNLELQQKLETIEGDVESV